MSEKPVMLLVTAATRDEAEDLGEGLLSAGLAWRGSVIPGVHSFWLNDGRLERGHEAMLLVTTHAGKAEQVRAYIREHHSFEAPHMLTLALADETTA